MLALGLSAFPSPDFLLHQAAFLWESAFAGGGDLDLVEFLLILFNFYLLHFLHKICPSLGVLLLLSQFLLWRLSANLGFFHLS